MADATPSFAGTTGPSDSGSSRRGGHSRNFSGEHRPRGNGRGRGGQRGGRGRGRGQSRGAAFSSQPSEGHTQLRNMETPTSNSGGNLTEAASQDQDEADPAVENNASQQEQAQEEAVTDDAELCFICASPIDHISIAPCNHQTCHICALRLRALYKTRACAHCRTESPMVIFTDNPDKRFQDFEDSDFAKVDDNLGVKYEKTDILEDTILLLRYNCPDKTCEVACLGWPDLHRHVRGKHGKVMCDLCTRNKKVFTHEHELFTFGELRRHEKYGDDNPGAVDQSGFKGHPECAFCRQRFYGDDELYTHCREKHERCHICDRRNNGRNPQYYLNYQELEKHFADVHFVCLDAECQANKTNVFESEMDLKAHQLSAHPNGLSKGRDARLVNLSGFDLRTPYQPSRRGGREGREGRESRGIGRGRDPNAEPLPMSSAQSLSRAEIAYQRQIAIQNASAQSSAIRTPAFGGSLTQPQRPTPPAQRPQNQSQPQSQSSTEPPPLDSLSLDSPAATVDTANMTPQERARHLRHTAVTTRAQNLLQNNTTKLSQFRTHVSSYRSGTITPSDLIDAFFSLFDCPSSELGKLIRELADLYEDEPKRQSLLQAWNNWRSINEDYPSLPGPQGTLPGSSSIGLNNVSTGRRVLKLKSSTAASSRSVVSRQGSWGNALEFPTAAATPRASTQRAQPNSREAFPALASGVASHNRNIPGWGPAPSASAPQTTASRVAAMANANGSNNRTNINSMRPPATMSPRQNEDMFPSLPAASKPNVMMAGFNTRGTAKWGNSGTASPSPWASGSNTPTPAEMSNALDDAADAGGSKKKGKKAKQTLFHFG